MLKTPETTPRQRWTLLLVCTAAFMLLLDITVVGVALPSIQRDLHANLSDLQWVSAAYALVLTVLLLPAATLGDRTGRAAHAAAAFAALGATVGFAFAPDPVKQPAPTRDELSTKAAADATAGLAIPQTRD